MAADVAHDELLRADRHMVNDGDGVRRTGRNKDRCGAAQRGAPWATHMAASVAHDELLRTDAWSMASCGLRTADNRGWGWSELRPTRTGRDAQGER